MDNSGKSKQEKFAELQQKVTSKAVQNLAAAKNTAPVHAKPSVQPAKVGATHAQAQSVRPTERLTPFSKEVIYISHENPSCTVNVKIDAHVTGTYEIVNQHVFKLPAVQLEVTKAAIQALKDMSQTNVPAMELSKHTSEISDNAMKMMAMAQRNNGVVFKTLLINPLVTTEGKEKIKAALSAGNDTERLAPYSKSMIYVSQEGANRVNVNIDLSFSGTYTVTNPAVFNINKVQLELTKAAFQAVKAMNVPAMDLVKHSSKISQDTIAILKSGPVNLGVDFKSLLLIPKVTDEGKEKIKAAATPVSKPAGAFGAASKFVAAQKPSGWFCQFCGSKNEGNFCANCGSPKK